MTTSAPLTSAVIAAANAALPLPATTMSNSASQACWAAAREAENGIAPIEPAATAAPTPLALRKPRRETRRRGSTAEPDCDMALTSLSGDSPSSWTGVGGVRECPASEVAEILHLGNKLATTATEAARRARLAASVAVAFRGPGHNQCGLRGKAAGPTAGRSRGPIEEMTPWRQA